MRHWSFSNTIIPRLAAYLASLDLMCVSSEEKGEGVTIGSVQRVGFFNIGSGSGQNTG